MSLAEVSSAVVMEARRISVRLRVLGVVEHADNNGAIGGSSRSRGCLGARTDIQWCHSCAKSRCCPLPSSDRAPPDARETPRTRIAK